MSQDHLNAVRASGCRICGATPAEAHHVRGGSITARLGVTGRRKTSDYLAIGLCPEHHRGQFGIHKMGTKAWEAEFNSQVSLVADQGSAMRADLWKLAEIDQIFQREARKYQRPSKIIKHSGKL